jgi:hypothetical protein
VSTVDVAGAVTAIGGSRIDSVVGQVAMVELLPNTLLQRSMLTSSGPLPASEAMVGVALTPGQLPAAGLAEGATVRVLQLPSKDNVTGGGSAASTAIVLAAQATVYGSASDPSQTGGTLVTLIVPKAASSAIAAASSAGRVALVQVGR